MTFDWGMNRNKPVLATATAALLALAAPVHATGLSYNYLEAGYVQADLDDVDVDLKSVFVNGSFLVSEEVFLFAGYEDGESDSFDTFLGRGKLGFSGFNAGVGYRIGVAPQTDLNLAAAFQRIRVEGKGALSVLGSDSENGYSLSVGLRHLVTPGFELNAGVTYIDVGDSDDTLFSVRGLFHIGDIVALGLGYSIGSDADAVSGLVRLKF